jgi:hypothetical protein
MKSITISLPSSDLASRKLAIIERNKIERYLSNGSTKVRLNLSNVSSLSESYSDELFGVLVLKHGVDKVLDNIQLDGAKKHILLSIAKVINRRKVQIKASNHEHMDVVTLA